MIVDSWGLSLPVHGKKSGQSKALPIVFSPPLAETKASVAAPGLGLAVQAVETPEEVRKAYCPAVVHQLEAGEHRRSRRPGSTDHMVRCNRTHNMLLKTRLRYNPLP